MSSTDTDPKTDPDVTAPAAAATTAEDPPKRKGKGKKAKPPASDDPAHDLPAAADGTATCVLSDAVVYNCSDEVAHRYKWREIGTQFAAIVTRVNGNEVDLFVMPPGDNPFSATAVTEGDGPHTWQHRDIPF